MDPKEINTGGPAFPESVALDPHHGQVFPASEFHAAPGMTLRDYFAAKTIPMFLAQSAKREELTPADYCDAVAKAAYQVADAMLKVREAQ